VLDAASFAAVIGALVAMRHRAPPRVSANISIQAAIDGLRFLLRTPLILSTMVLDAVATFFAGSLLLLPLYADRILAVGPRGLGLLYAAQPAGAALAAAALATRPTIHRQGAAVLWSIVLYGASVAAFGVSSWLPLSLFLLAISGAADTVSMVVRQTLRQMLTPDELRGRMTSVNMIFFIGGPQLGEFEAGVVARAVGPRFSVTSGGLACVRRRAGHRARRAVAAQADVEGLPGQRADIVAGRVGQNDHDACARGQFARVLERARQRRARRATDEDSLFARQTLHGRARVAVLDLNLGAELGTQ